MEKWLSAFDPSGNYNIAIDKRNEGSSNSGRWFLLSERFVEWKNVRKSFLWLRGHAGCGKTILCSTAIEHLKLEVDRTVLYFYFAFNDQRTRSKGSLLRSLIMQLSRYDERAMEKLVEQKKDEQPSDKKLGEIFMSMATLLEQITIVLDGIDELDGKSEERRNVLQWVKDTIETKTADIRILASSRNERDIATKLEGISPPFEFTAGTVEDDIKAFVHKHIHDESSHLRRWRNHPDVQKMIEDTLTEKANGMSVTRPSPNPKPFGKTVILYIQSYCMNITVALTIFRFRWVACQIQAIQNCLNLKSLSAQLSSLPKTLDETYDRILQSLCETQRREVIKLLQFLVFAGRPVDLFEAIDLIAVDLDETPSFDPMNRIPEPQEIVEICSSLVVFDLRETKRRRLQLAHFSVEEYLVSGRMGPDLAEHFKEIPASYSILKICLGYLESVLPSVTRISMSVPDDMDLFTQSDEETNWRHNLSRFPLMEYAINKWPFHAQHCNRHARAAVRIHEFFEHKSCLVKWLFCFCDTWFLPVLVDKCERLEISCPIFLSIYLGLQEIALEMIDKSLKLESEVMPKEVIFHLPADRSSLFEHCGMAYLTRDGRYSLTSHLYLAVGRDMHDVVKALIQRGINIHKKGGNRGTALNLACILGSKDIVTTLLQHSRDNFSQDCHKMYVQGALEIIINNWDKFDLYAIVPGRDQLVKSCLNLSNPGPSLDDCLKTMFFNVNPDLTRMLIRNGARIDVVAQENLRHTFFDESVLLSFIRVFSEEKSGDADPGALRKLFTTVFIPKSPGKRCTMIQQTIERHFNAVLMFMIDGCIDRQCSVPLDELESNTSWCTALFLAVKANNTVAVQILLGVETNPPYKGGYRHYTPPIEYIDEKNGYRKETGLHVAAKRGYIKIMKALLSCKAALDTKDLYSRTPLHYACRNHRYEAVRLLVEHGANLQALDFHKNTPLQLVREWTVNYSESSKGFIEWLEQRSSRISSDHGSHTERKNETDDNDSSSTGRDSKRQKTG